MDDDKTLKNILANLQSECDKLYATYGATNNIISLQVAINSLRHEYDLCDKAECLYEDYVQ